MRDSRYEVNPFSDPLLFVAKPDVVQRILRSYPVRVNIYGAVCSGRRTIMTYVYTRTPLGRQILAKHSNGFITISFERLFRVGYDIVNIPVDPWDIHTLELYMLTSFKNIGRKVHVTHEFLDKLMAYSSGNPCVISRVMYHIFDAVERRHNWITIEHLENAKHKFEYTLSLQFKSLYASLSPLEKELIAVGIMNSGGAVLASPITLERITGRRLHTVTKSLYRLVHKGIVRKLGRGRYELFSRAFYEVMFSTTRR